MKIFLRLTCRQITKCPNNNISSLPSNLFCKQLVEIVEAYTGQGHEDSPQRCGNCEKKKALEYYCSDCNFFLCEECVEAHRKWRNFSGHEIKETWKFQFDRHASLRLEGQRLQQTQGWVAILLRKMQNLHLSWLHHIKASRRWKPQHNFPWTRTWKQEIWHFKKNARRGNNSLSCERPKGIPGEAKRKRAK